MQLACFNIFRDWFYVNNVKIVPYNIIELFTSVSLAFWIMDDGSKHGNGLHLNVYGFDDDSVNRILSVLQTKLNLFFTLHLHSNKEGYRIYIHKESMTNLVCLVKPNLIPSMFYKLGV